MIERIGSENVNQEKIHLLQNMPIFGGINDSAIEFLVGQTTEKEFAPEEYFFKEGDPASSLFIIESGKAEVLKLHEDHQLILRYLGNGDCFGEMSLIDMNPRSASVKAIEKCTTLELTNTDLMGLYEFNLEQFTLIQMNLAREVSRRLRDIDQKLSKLNPELTTLVAS